MSAPPPLPRRDRAARIVAGLILVPTLGLAVVMAITHWRLASAISRETDALRLAGCPMTINDCVKDYRSLVASANNAASAYDQAFASITNVARIGVLFPASARRTLPKWNAEQEKIALEVLRDNAGALSKVDACLRYPYAYRDLKWDAGYAMLLRHVANLKPLLELIEVHAILAIRNHESDTAVADVDHLIRVADSLGQEPVLVDVLIRERFHVVACRLIREMLSTQKLSDGQLATLASFTVKMSLQEQLLRSLDLERIATLKVFEGSNHDVQEYFDILYEHDESPHRETTFDIIYMRLSGALKRDCLFYLKCMRGIQAAAANTGTQRIQVAAPIADAIYREKSLNQVRVDSIWTKAHAKLISETFLPNVIGALEKIVRHDAEAALTSTAIAAARYQKRTGQWPKSYHELEVEPFKASSINPFTGAPFNFVPVDDSFLIVAEQRHFLPTVQMRSATEPLAIRLTKSD